MTSEREREIWDDPESEEHLLEGYDPESHSFAREENQTYCMYCGRDYNDPAHHRPRIVRGTGGKPVCFGCFGSKSECREDEQGIVHCPWANLCEDPEYPYR